MSIWAHIWANTFYRLAILNIVIVVVCLLLANFLGYDIRIREDKPPQIVQAGYIEITIFYAIMTAACGVLTFFTLLNHGLRSASDSMQESAAMQFSIAAAMLVVFIVSYSTTFYWGEGETSSSFFKTMFPAFSNLLGVIFAFYFGSTAAVQIWGPPPTRRAPTDSTDLPSDKP